MPDGVSNEPVIASTPAPISVEPIIATPAQVAESARQAEEANLKSEPPKAKGEEPVVKEEKPKPTAREAIRAAAAKVNAEPVADKAKPLSVAEQPVAKDAKAEPAVAKADAPVVKDVKAEPVVAKDAPARADDGKFVSTKPAAEPVEKTEPAKVAALPSHTAEPAPKRFSAEAKEEWAALPEKSRAEVARMERELTAGFEKNRAAAERDASLAEFHEMAGKSQKNLKDVVTQYVGMENLLRSDTIKGLELICQNAGLSLKDVAAKVLGQAPDAVASAADAELRAVRTELADLKKSLGIVVAERQQAKTDTTTEAVTKFASDPAHSRFEELSEDIAFFLKTKTKDLAEAYKMAERFNPVPATAAPAPSAVVASSAPPATAPKPTLVPPAAQPRDVGALSIHGTPTAGSDPVRKQPSNSIREAIRKAAAAAG